MSSDPERDCFKCDYLVVGAGASGLSFVDALLFDPLPLERTRSKFVDRAALTAFRAPSPPKTRILLIDKRARAGGHWNDAYDFCTLHQPATMYGASSLRIVSDEEAARRLVSAAEVREYFGTRVMDKLLGTGAVEFWGGWEFRGSALRGGDEDLRRGTFAVGRVGEEGTRSVRAKVFVDARYSENTVPAMVGRDLFPEAERTFGVAPEISEQVRPPNALVGENVAKPDRFFVVVGAGKTGIDAVLQLLRSSPPVPPENILWIDPSGSWLIDRRAFYPSNVLKFVRSMVGASREMNLREFDERSDAGNKAYLWFSSLSKQTGVHPAHRIDESTRPKAFRCASVSVEEIDEIRRAAGIRYDETEGLWKTPAPPPEKSMHILRGRRLRRIDESHLLHLAGDGAAFSVPLHFGISARDADRVVYVDCTARGLRRRPPVPIWSAALAPDAARRVVLQTVFMCQICASASAIGFLEACNRMTPAEKNAALADPVPYAAVPNDLAAGILCNLNTQARLKRAGLPPWTSLNRLGEDYHTYKYLREDLSCMELARKGFSLGCQVLCNFRRMKHIVTEVKKEGEMTEVKKEGEMTEVKKEGEMTEVKKEGENAGHSTKA